MVLSGDVESNLADTGCVLQDEDALHNMRFHLAEFGFGELGRLVEDVVRHLGFADVVQQAADGDFLDDLALQFEAAREGNQQGADGNGVLKRVVVVVLQASQRQQRILIAENRVDHVLDDRFDLFHLDLFAQAHVLNQIAHDAVGLAVQLAGAFDFLRQIDALRLNLDFLRDLRHARIDILANVGFALSHTFDIQALGSVDVQLMHAQRLDFIDALGVVDLEMIGYEWMVHPGAIDVLDIHAGAQLAYGDQLDGVCLFHVSAFLA